MSVVLTFDNRDQAAQAEMHLEEVKALRKENKHLKDAIAKIMAPEEMAAYVLRLERENAHLRIQIATLENEKRQINAGS